MTAINERPVAFHLGFVVRDVDAATKRYEGLLGEMRWHVWEARFPAMPFNPDITDSRLKIAYGRMAGLTIEFIQVLEGETVHTGFLRDHGEGVQHIGVWVPDVQKAVAGAVEQGARVTMAMLRGDTAAVQLSSASPPREVVAAMHPERMAYVDIETGGVAIEYVGPAAYEGLHRVMGNDFAHIIIAPPWIEADPRSA